MPSNVPGTVNAANHTDMVSALRLLIVQTSLESEARKISPNRLWEENETEGKREEIGKDVWSFPTGKMKKVEESFWVD